MSAAMSEQGQQLQQEMQDVAHTAKDQVIDLRDTARSRLEGEVDRRRTELGNGARRFADSTRETSRELRDEGNELPAMLIERAGDGIERAASYLERTDADRMWQDVREFGRRNPWAFVAAGVAAGFVAARMIKVAGEDPWSGQRPEPAMQGTEGMRGMQGATPSGVGGGDGDLDRFPEAPVTGAVWAGRPSEVTEP